MIPEKTPAVPQLRRSVVSITPQKLKENNGVYDVLALHLKEEGGALVSAESSEDICASNSGIIALLEGDGKPFGVAMLGSTPILYDYTSGIGHSGFTTPVRSIYVCDTPFGEPRLYVMTEDSLYYLKDDMVRRIANTGGEHAVVHRERVFKSAGNKIAYTAPLAVESWDLEEAYTGEIALSTAGGNILALVPYEENLLVFREWEILRMRAQAEDLKFAFEHVDFEAGEILAESVQPCGKSVLFCTAQGICTVEGSKVAMVYRFPRAVVPAEPFSTGAHEGVYYAVVTAAGENCILAYDSASGASHLIRTGAELLTSTREGICFKRGGRILRLAGQGVPLYEEEGSKLSFGIDLSKNGEPVLIDGVSFAGEGNISLTLETEEGSAELSLEGEGRKRLSRVLRGNHARIQLCSKGLVKLRSLLLHLREETA